LRAHLKVAYVLQELDGIPLARPFPVGERS
jgi:hypothetical protein